MARFSEFYPGRMQRARAPRMGLRHYRMLAECLRSVLGSPGAGDAPERRPYCAALRPLPGPAPTLLVVTEDCRPCPIMLGD
jgi:hypothetical protein